jgi:hypothetical protein
MKTLIKSLFTLTLFISLNRCAPSRFVKTLEKKQQVLAFSFGGPLIKFSGAPIPIPFTTVVYANGLSSKITAYGSLHLTSALFGNLQSDIGATFKLFEKENQFGCSASPALQFAYNLRNSSGFRVWPTADLNAYCHLNKKPSYLYAGLNTWFELSSTKAHGEVQQRHIIPNVHAGYTIVNTKWQHQFEFKYLGIGIPNLPGVVDYIGVGGKGSFGFYYSLIRKF